MILDDEAAVYQPHTYRACLALATGSGYPAGQMIKVAMPVQPAHIKLMHLV